MQLTPALEAGSAKAVNIVLMGRLARHFDIPREKWTAAIEQSVAPKFVEMNEKAFALGYDAEKLRCAMKYWQEEIETMPHEKIEELQTERLIKQVGRVYDNVELYRNRMDAAGKALRHKVS